MKINQCILSPRNGGRHIIFKKLNSVNNVKKKHDRSENCTMWQYLHEIQEAVGSLLMNQMSWDRGVGKAIWAASGMAGGEGSPRRAN